MGGRFLGVGELRVVPPALPHFRSVLGQTWVAFPLWAASEFSATPRWYHLCRP